MVDGVISECLYKSDFPRVTSSEYYLSNPLLYNKLSIIIFYGDVFFLIAQFFFVLI